MSRLLASKVATYNIRASLFRSRANKENWAAKMAAETPRAVKKLTSPSPALSFALFNASSALAMCVVYFDNAEVTSTKETDGGPKLAPATALSYNCDAIMEYISGLEKR